MLKHYDFECLACSHVFDEYVEGADGMPDVCPQCVSTFSFHKLPSAPALLKEIIPSYPGSNRLKAGYQHTHNRPAEKKGTQVSMLSTKS